jgi:hypothetical protein
LEPVLPVLPVQVLVLLLELQLLEQPGELQALVLLLQVRQALLQVLLQVQLHHH